MRILFTILSALMIYSINTFACEGSCNHGMVKDMTPEERAQMADVHSKIAECLKNKEEPLANCHKIMEENMPHKGDHKSCGHEGKHEGKKHHHEKHHNDAKESKEEKK